MREFFERNDYPDNKEYLLKNSFRKVGEWIFLEDDQLREKFACFRENDGFEKMLPFAESKIYTACFCEESGNTIFIVDNLTSRFRVVEKFNDIYSWMRELLRRYVDKEIFRSKVGCEVLTEIGELFYDIETFAKKTEEIDININSVEAFWFGKFGPYFDINLLRRNNLSVKDGFTVLFKNDLFLTYDWDKADDARYRDEGWKDILEKNWMPEYFLSFKGFALEEIEASQYKQKLLKFNDKLDEDGRRFNIPNKEFKGAMGIRFNKSGLSEKIFIVTQNYYITYEEGIAD